MRGYGEREKALTLEVLKVSRRAGSDQKNIQHQWSVCFVFKSRWAILRHIRQSVAVVLVERRNMALQSREEKLQKQNP